MEKKARIDLAKVGTQENKTSSASIAKGDATSSADRKPEGSRIKRKRKPLIFAMAGLILLCGSLGAVWKLGWILLPGSPHGKRPESPASERSEIGPTIKLSPFIINLKEESGRTYLKTTIVLEVGKKDRVEEIKSKMSTLTDIVILTLGDKRLEDLRPLESKEKLKQELLVKMNQYLDSNKIKRIYFDEFLFQ